MLLSDAFGVFIIDEEETTKNCAKFCPPEQYSAKIHLTGWFLTLPTIGKRKEEERELMDHKAVFYYRRRQFVDALEAYDLLLRGFNHNRTYSVAIIDSLVRCALKIPSFPDDQLLSYLHEYERNALDFGCQLQFFNVAKIVYSHIGGEEAQCKFIDTVCLLCATVDLPENWLAFGSKQELKVGENFHIGYHVRAVMLLERQLKQARGFVVDTMRKKISRLNGKLASIASSDEKILEAKKRMGADIVWNDDTIEMGEEMQRPVHDCKSKEVAYKSADDCRKVIDEFRHKFRWMFSEYSV